MKTIRELQHRLDRHENAYWYHYIMANRALERGNAGDFVQEMLDIWLTVVVPLEATYQTLDTLVALRRAELGLPRGAAVRVREHRAA